MYILKNLKLLKIVNISVISFTFLLIPAFLYAEVTSSLIFDASSIKGDWQDAIFLNRSVKLADKVGQKATLKIEVPKDGYYKIYLHLYYKWEKTCPKIDFVIINANKRFAGSLALETNRIAPEIYGRWVFKVLETPRPIYLKEGLAKISLTLKSIDSFWLEEKALNTTTGVVAIDYIFLQPIIFDNKKVMSMDIIEAESFRGDCLVKNFDIVEKTGFIDIPSKKSTFRTIRIPYSGLFDIYALIKLANKQKENNFLKIEVSNEKYKFFKTILLSFDNTKWQLQHIGKVFFENDVYNFKIYGRDNNKISIDFLLFIPTQNQKN